MSAVEEILSLLEKQVRENGNLLIMASKIKDPKAQINVLDRITVGIDKTKKIIKELK